MVACVKPCERDLCLQHMYQLYQLYQTKFEKCTMTNALKWLHVTFTVNTADPAIPVKILGPENIGLVNIQINARFKIDEIQN